MTPRRPTLRPLRAASARQAGMTLLEIMIVLAIIALVMGFLLGPAVMNALGSSKVKTAHAVAKKFHYEAYTRWASDNPSKQCPDDIKSLTKYMNSEDVKDPWSRDFVMLCGSNAPEGVQGGFGVMSKGENEGDPADDIKSWMAPPSD